MANNESSAPKKGRIVSITMTDLLKKQFPEMRFVVPGIIPEGLSILAGKPKIGKSWLAMELCISVATGGMCLGQCVGIQGDVLYCALEDSDRRLNDRVRRMVTGGMTFPPGSTDRITLATQWPRMSEGFIKEIKAWIARSPMPALIIIDTLAKIRDANGSSDQTYAVDYKIIGDILDITNSLGISILILTHQRKMEAQDPIDTIQGSSGITGVADTILLLAQDSGKGMSLYVRGRDVEEQDLAMRFDKTKFRWICDGNADDAHMGKTKRKVLEVIEHSGPIGRNAIANAVGIAGPTATNHLKDLLDSGLIIKNESGQYEVSS